MAASAIFPENTVRYLDGKAFRNFPIYKYRSENSGRGREPIFEIDIFDILCR
jgi:hypothetical protein